jgi:hypothetical protein
MLFIVISISNAILNHTIIETRPYYSSWVTYYQIVDSDTGKIYSHAYNTDHDPSSVEKGNYAVILKERTQLNIDYQANNLNLTLDEDILLGYYRLIKRGIVLQIRLYPASTLIQASAYISTQYPNSPFDFDELYARWLVITGSLDWSAFKVFCINHKFVGID